MIACTVRTNPYIFEHKYILYFKTLDWLWYRQMRKFTHNKIFHEKPLSCSVEHSLICLFAINLTNNHLCIDLQLFLDQM